MKLVYILSTMPRTESTPPPPYVEETCFSRIEFGLFFEKNKLPSSDTSDSRIVCFSCFLIVQFLGI